MSITLKRWLINWKIVVNDIVTFIGLYWLFVEIFSYSTNNATDIYFKSITVFSIAFILICFTSLVKNKPKKSFQYKLRDKDNYITVRVGDAFRNSGSLVIPINDHFDTSLGGNVKKAKSLQNKLITDFYAGKHEHLAKDISSKVTIGNTYDTGTTIEVEQNGKKFYLLVNSKKKENNRVESTVDDFLLCLSKLWEYIALESGRDDVVTIPLISTRHGRITDLNRTNAIKEIIRSYVESSKHLNIADSLIISIHPDDIKKGDIDLDEINDYLKFSCHHYRHVQFDEKVEGTEISPSDIKSIST